VPPPHQLHQHRKADTRTGDLKVLDLRTGTLHSAYTNASFYQSAHRVPPGLAERRPTIERTLSSDVRQAA